MELVLIGLADESDVIVKKKRGMKKICNDESMVGSKDLRLWLN